MKFDVSKWMYLKTIRYVVQSKFPAEIAKTFITDEKFERHFGT